MINTDRLLDTFLGLARIPSPSGQEQAVAALVSQRLAALGFPAANDQAGNVIAQTPGEGEPLLLTAHMDTVGPCDRIHPVVRDGSVYSDGSSILGADDKSGIAAILEVLAVLVETGLAHRPLDLAFTVREEVGLAGAKALDRGMLRARLGVGLDAGGPPGTLVASAPSQNSLWAAIHGRAAHAGVNPEEGVNAIRVAAEAIVGMPLGRIDEQTTANIGVISGGSATNIVPDYVTLKGEARSRSECRLEQQTRLMVRSLERSASAGGATVEVEVTRMYDGYELSEEDAIIRLVGGAMRTLGIEPQMVPTGGGSDANVFNAAGIETVQISTGMSAVHTINEHVAVDDMLMAARILLACATG